METTLLVIQVVTSIFMGLFILLQSRGEGLSGGIAGSGGGEFYATRRGVEKFLFRATVVLAFIFAMNALVFAFLPRG
ncbi:preprotein translocase subunit SecG [Candidatus Peregrinibacteria bacterium]|nr:preprotein translocase subunit SecG [Candidatus Peregrinibacteria bacterium]